jgi:hypothetical protein
MAADRIFIATEKMEWAKTIESAESSVYAAWLCDCGRRHVRFRHKKHGRISSPSTGEKEAVFLPFFFRR